MFNKAFSAIVLLTHVATTMAQTPEPICAPCDDSTDCPAVGDATFRCCFATPGVPGQCLPATAEISSLGTLLTSIITDPVLLIVLNSITATANIPCPDL